MNETEHCPQPEMTHKQKESQVFNLHHLKSRQRNAASHAIQTTNSNVMMVIYSGLADIITSHLETLSHT